LSDFEVLELNAIVTDIKRPSDRKSDKWSQNSLFLGFLRALHARGLAHQDIRPSNILLDEWLYQHVANTGTPSYVRSVRNSHCSVTGGTKKYMSPDLFEEGELTEWIDVM
jgi:serine/threonine protein kinase